MGSRVLAKRYELIEKIGEGGMAVVFKAYDRSLGRNVALKILRPEYTNDENFIESFRRESQLVAGIVDPNIVQVYDVGQEGNIHYIVMELVEGETLSEIINREGALDAKTVVNYGKQIAMALSTAHKNNLIHRDIKPHNIMVTFDGVAKLTDFGIAKRQNPNNTMVGDEKEAVMGSIHYFSPEQARGNKVDGRTDIYSLGIVMYEMLTGQVPFDGDNAVEVAVKHMNEPMVAPSLKVRGVPQDLEDIILKATAKDAADRYANAEEMITALSFVKMSRLADNYEDEDDSDMTIVTKQKKRSNRTLLVTLIIILIPLIAGIYDVISATVKENRRTVAVPDLKGYSLEEATSMLKELELNIIVASNQIINDNYPPETVTSQDPLPEAIVKPGQNIKVNITRPEPDPTIPDLVNIELTSAKNRLEGMGYKVGELTYEYNDRVGENYIIATKPVFGTSFPKGSAVDLVVSKGQDPEGKRSFTIDVRGMSLADAKALIESKNCTVNEDIDYRAGGTVNPGCVISQSPDYNVEVYEGRSFYLTVRQEEMESTVVLTVDLSGVTEENYTLSIVLKDGAHPDGYTYLEAATYEKDADSVSFSVTGKGSGTAYVTLDTGVIIYSIDFNNGSVFRN